MTTIGDRYKDGGIGAHLYRWLRLDHGGLRALAAHFPREGRIVDLGSGAGLLAHVLVEDAPTRHVLCVDHDAARLASLRTSAAGLPIEAIEADMASFDVPPCEGVALVDVLHYLDEDAQEALLARAAEALAPGGVLVLRDPDPDGGLRFDLTRAHEALATRLGLTHARVGRYRRGHDWAFQLRLLGLETQVLPLGRLTPYSDRTVVGIRR